jgi:hypothetical protein
MTRRETPLSKALAPAIEYSGASKKDIAKAGGIDAATLSRILHQGFVPDDETFQALLDGHIPKILHDGLWTAYLQSVVPENVAKRLSIRVRSSRANYQRLAQPGNEELKPIYHNLDGELREALAYFVVHGHEALCRARIIQLYQAQIGE